MAGLKKQEEGGIFSWSTPFAEAIQKIIGRKDDEIALDEYQAWFLDQVLAHHPASICPGPDSRPQSVGA